MCVRCAFDCVARADLVRRPIAGPDLGTADGATVPAAVAETLIAQCAASGYSHSYNGRFKGGYITRHYGDPAAGVDAVQLELTQCNYMDESAPYAYDETKAAKLQPVLRSLLSLLAEGHPAR